MRALSEAKARRAQRWAGIEGRQKSHLTRSEGPRRRMRCTPLVRCTRTCAAGAGASVSSRWRATALLAQGKARPPASHPYEWPERMLTSKTAAPPPSKKNAKNANHSPCGVHPLTQAEQSDAEATKVLGESSAARGISLCSNTPLQWRSKGPRHTGQLPPPAACPARGRAEAYPRPCPSQTTG